MTKTIAALYDDFATAERVIDNLLEAGFSETDISMMANDSNGRLRGAHDMVTDGDVSAGEGAGFGALIGTLIGVGAALIPGIGPIIGAGPLAVALTAGVGAAAGALTGGVTAGLVDMGVDEDDANRYAEGVRRGGTLISLTTNDEWAERAETIMNRYQPVDLDVRSSLWRERGWTKFDHNAPPYNADQIEQERLIARDYETAGGDHWAANRATQAQNEHAAKMSGAIPHSTVGATRSDDVAAGATPPGAERHHEASQGVDHAMRRDTSGVPAESDDDQRAR